MTTVGRGSNLVWLCIVGASLTACGGGDDDDRPIAGQGSGASGEGGAGGQSMSGGKSGGGGKSAGSGGTTTGDDCGEAKFEGPAGTLWVERRPDGELTSFDTKDGKLLKTVMPPGYSTTFAGGNGLLWLVNTDNNRDITPFDPENDKAFPGLGVDPDDTPVFAGGALWVTGPDAMDMVDAYAFSSPTDLKSFTVNYGVIASTAIDDGLYFIGGFHPGDGPGQWIVHVDADDSQVVWRLSEADVPGLQGWAQKAGHTSMVVIGNKLFVKGVGPMADPTFVIDVTTQKQVAEAMLDFNAGDNSFGDLLTDGTGLYVLDNDTFYEIDQDTLEPKRKLDLGETTYSDDAPIFAGAAWFGRICGGKTYIRRVDLADWSVADILYPSGEGEAPQGYAYIAP